MCSHNHTLLQVFDQVTGMLEVRAKTDKAALAGEETVLGFLNDPEPGTIYRSVSHIPLTFVVKMKAFSTILSNESVLHATGLFQ